MTYTIIEKTSLSDGRYEIRIADNRVAMIALFEGDKTVAEIDIELQELTDFHFQTLDNPVQSSPDLAALKVNTMQRVITFADTITDRIMSGYPKAEIQSWSVQREQAQRVSAGEVLDAGDLLYQLADRAGVPITDYAATVLAKADAFTAITVEVKDLRDQASATIAAMTDPNEIEPAFAVLRDAAEAKAADLGLV